MAGLVPATHALLGCAKDVVPGTRPGMTTERMCVQPTGISSSVDCRMRDRVFCNHAPVALRLQNTTNYKSRPHRTGITFGFNVRTKRTLEWNKRNNKQEQVKEQVKEQARRTAPNKTPGRTIPAGRKSRVSIS